MDNVRRVRHYALGLGLLFGFLFSFAGAQTLTVGGGVWPNGWPLDGVPTPEQRSEEPEARAYAQALQSWLEANPEVTFEQIEFNVWDQETIVTALAGGTAPSLFNANAVGGWDTPGARPAVAQGLLADVTEAYESSGIGEDLASYVRPLWEQWQVDGRLYALPTSYVAGVGVYYRKDLIREAGLEEPQPGWTWDDFHALLEGLTESGQKGAVMQSWIPNSELNANGWSSLTQVPAPDTPWNWRWDYTTNVDLWEPIIRRWRKAILEDQSVITNPAGLADYEVAAAFVRGDAAMMFNNYFWYTRPPSDPESMAGLAERLGKPLEEVVGWVELPLGSLGAPSPTAGLISAAGVSPHLGGDALDKAVSVFDYMTFGEGYTTQQRLLWEETGDLKRVYRDPLPINGVTQLPGVPGSIEDAWDEAFLENVRDAASNPVKPVPALYLPAEAAPGPGEDAFNDAINQLLFTEGEADVQAALAEAERITNQQAASFTSSVPDDVFVEGVTQVLRRPQRLLRGAFAGVLRAGRQPLV